MTLYLKYRPRNLDELDLTEVGLSLKKIVISGNVPHAFLFAGPKGTGKTSAARILSKILTCTNLKDGTPCDKCDQCISIANGSNLDVIEMDAASHRGIDDVRTLRDAVKLAPLKASKKIYIIDEAHMLTTEASNALLKTLEEPPAHVIFILATTNPEKLLDTIKSRTTLIQFKKATNEEIANSLKRVASGEKIEIQEAALTVIATAADGAFRDAIKILEQVVSEGQTLSPESLQEYLFQKKAFDVDHFVKLLSDRDTKTLIGEIEKLGSRGASIENFLTALLARLREMLLVSVGVIEGEKSTFEKGDLVQLLELLGDASVRAADSPIEELPLEIAVIKWCEGLEKTTKKVSEGSVEEVQETKKSQESKIKSEESVPQPTPDTLSSGSLDMVNDEIWRNILGLVKPINASVEALLRAARPVAYDGKVLTLGVYYKFHKERLEDTTHRRVLEDVIGRVLNAPTKVVCTLTEPAPRKVVEEAKVEPVLTEGNDPDIIKVAEEIFGN